MLTVGDRTEWQESVLEYSEVFLGIWLQKQQKTLKIYK